jgi:hypothetical protein
MQLLNAGQRLPSTNTWSNCTLSASTARFIANIVACKILMLSISLALDSPNAPNDLEQRIKEYQ